MHVTFGIVPDDSLIVTTCAVRFDIDTERTVDLQFESNGMSIA